MKLQNTCAILHSPHSRRCQTIDFPILINLNSLISPGGFGVDFFLVVAAKSGLTRKILRVAGRFSPLAGCVCFCFADCLLQAAFRRGAASRSRVLQRWSRRILRVIGVELVVTGPVPARGLIASNHLSYLDIWVYSAAARCAFVAKSEIKSWPLVGWIASLTGTVFVDRSRASQTLSLQPEIQKRLESERCLVLFPEGTSANGRDVLPFRSSLFEAPVAMAAPITAAHLGFELPEGDGDPVMDVCYWGEMTMFPHLMKLLTKARIRATVTFAEKARVFSDRKQAALETQQEVAQLGKRTAVRQARGQAAALGVDRQLLPTAPHHGSN